MLRLFAPGCALMLYKPHLADTIHRLLCKKFSEVPRLSRCCRNKPLLQEGTEVINICPGCDKRYRNNDHHSSTVSLWEILADCPSFTFPDYHGKRMSIMDACPTRDQGRVHDAVRALLQKMNIVLVEPERTKGKSICCGDSLWNEIPLEKVKSKMKKRADQMPLQDVVVYCVSCINAMFIGGRQPRYLVDLLFGETTHPTTLDLDLWHHKLNTYMISH